MQQSHFEVGNDKVGLTILLRSLGRDDALCVVFEATGPYHRHLGKTLAAANIVTIAVNPRLARRFVETIGRLGFSAEGATLLPRTRIATAPSSSAFFDCWNIVGGTS